MVACGAVEPDLRHLRRLLEAGGHPAAEIGDLARLVELLFRPPAAGELGLWFPRWAELRRGLLEAAGDDDPEQLEERVLELYCHLHMHEAPYTLEERSRLDATGGYWCHAGGLSPILKAGRWLDADSVSMDLGAGNGLQALLMQSLFPHRRTVQVEISARMVAVGRRLQTWLGVPPARVEWVVGDVMEADVTGVDLLYLYRPVRPEGVGRSFYQRLAGTLESSSRPVVVMSIADCLRDFLSDGWRQLYGDGHLTCLRWPG